MNERPESSDEDKHDRPESDSSAVLQRPSETPDAAPIARDGDQSIGNGPLPPEAPEELIAGDALQLGDESQNPGDDNVTDSGLRTADDHELGSSSDPHIDDVSDAADDDSPISIASGADELDSGPDLFDAGSANVDANDIQSPETLEGPVSGEDVDSAVALASDNEFSDDETADDGVGIDSAFDAPDTVSDASGPANWTPYGDSPGSDWGPFDSSPPVTSEPSSGWSGSTMPPLFLEVTLVRAMPLIEEVVARVAQQIDAMLDDRIQEHINAREFERRTEWRAANWF